MDLTTLIVTFLPLFISIAIILVRKKKFRLHKIVQIILFFLSITIIGYFEYDIRIVGGFESFMKESQVSHNYVFWVLIIHIVIATLTIFIWSYVIINSWIQSKAGKLPKNHSLKHRVRGIVTLAGIALTSLTGIWVYSLLFVY